MPEFGGVVSRVYGKLFASTQSNDHTNNGRCLTRAVTGSASENADDEIFFPIFDTSHAPIARHLYRRIVLVHSRSMHFFPRDRYNVYGSFLFFPFSNTNEIKL